LRRRRATPFFWRRACAPWWRRRNWSGRRGLSHLQAAEFLYETRLFPEHAYTFKHALTQQVAYETLLQERRRTLHARIVGAIEALYGNRLAEYVEQLAHHALRGEMGEKAVHYLRQAGNKAAARSALPDARDWFEQALVVLAALPESPSMQEQGCEIRLELRSALTTLGEIRRSLEHLREADALAERLNDDGRRGRGSAFALLAHNLLGELDEALVAGTRALEVAGRLGDLRLRLLPRLISSRRTTTEATTIGPSRWPPITWQRCPPTGSTSFAETPYRYRSTIATGWS
jgi:predicted ATPase